MINKKRFIYIFLFIISGFILDAVIDYRNKEILEKRLLHVSFDHVDHKATTCVSCHHNFIDQTGSGVCYSCHKQDQTIAREIEDMFHTFCMDCHMEERAKGEVAGPVRQCKPCHLKPVFISQSVR